MNGRTLSLFIGIFYAFVGVLISSLHLFETLNTNKQIRTNHVNVSENPNYLFQTYKIMPKNICNLQALTYTCTNRVFMHIFQLFQKYFLRPNFNRQWIPFPELILTIFCIHKKFFDIF